jgi:hypothetical protein
VSHPEPREAGRGEAREALGFERALQVLRDHANRQLNGIGHPRRVADDQQVR